MQKLHKPKDWRWLLHRALSIIFSRTVVTVVLVLAQAVWLFSVFYWLSDYSHLISRVGLAVSALMCLALVRKDSTAPEFKISWMILFMIMPVQGGLLYLMWGNKRPAIPLRRRMERAEAELAPLRTGDPAARAELARRDPRLAETADYLQNYAASPVFGGTAVRYYPVGDVMLPDMLADLQAAQHSIFVESFIIGMGEMWGQIHEILRQKAAAGLDVRVIYDDAGCLSLLPHNYVDLLRADGIRAFSFNRCVPVLNLVLNNRDHRKIMVVDGRIAYTGGVNLADEYINKVTRFGHWKDSGVRLEGPAARSYANVFSPVDREVVAKNVYLEFINQALHSLRICTPYLILDNDLLTCLSLAAKRGVDVRIYTPGVPDKKTIYQLSRSYFPHLLKAGVKIYSYTPGFLHAKTWLIDDRAAAVGTVNLDYRSLYLHFENSTVLYGGEVLSDIRRDLDGIESVSRRLGPDDCRNGFLGSMLSACLRLVAPLC